MPAMTRTLARVCALVRLWVAAFWAPAVLLAVAALSAAGAIFVQIRPDWTRRVDIRDFNRGISIYEAPAARGGSPAEQARVHLEKAIATSRDQRLKALALYNMATMAGKDALHGIRAARQAYATEGRGEDPSDVTVQVARQQIQEAVAQLAEAVRLDPSLEDAKFNLELLAKESVIVQVLGQRYAPGEVDKGY